MRILILMISVMFLAACGKEVGKNTPPVVGGPVGSPGTTYDPHDPWTSTEYDFANHDSVGSTNVIAHRSGLGNIQYNGQMYIQSVILSYKSSKIYLFVTLKDRDRKFIKECRLNQIDTNNPNDDSIYVYPENNEDKCVFEVQVDDYLEIREVMPQWSAKLLLQELDNE